MPPWSLRCTVLPLQYIQFGDWISARNAGPQHGEAEGGKRPGQRPVVEDQLLPAGTLDVDVFVRASSRVRSRHRVRRSAPGFSRSAAHRGAATPAQLAGGDAGPEVATAPAGRPTEEPRLDQPQRASSIATTGRSGRSRRSGARAPRRADLGRHRWCSRSPGPWRARPSRPGWLPRPPDRAVGSSAHGRPSRTDREPRRHGPASLRRGDRRRWTPLATRRRPTTRTVPREPPSASVPSSPGPATTMPLTGADSAAAGSGW